MSDSRTSEFVSPSPDLQVLFSKRLEDIRKLYLMNAVQTAVQKVSLNTLNSELEEYVCNDALQLVASYGLRGEVIFPVPCLLRANPYLLGYYRLLYGVSKKAFYSQGPFGRFSLMEKEGKLTPSASSYLEPLCRSLAQTGASLVTGVGRIDLEIVHDLQLLTLGPDMRGGTGNVIGHVAASSIYNLIHSIVKDHISKATDEVIEITNKSSRQVMIIFRDDPDVQIIEQGVTGEQPRIAVEIKGGADVSNVYNRIGEAEKSHNTAKAKGFLECWTIIRAAFNIEKAHTKLPTTNYFFQLDPVLDPGTEQHALFRDRLKVTLGI